MAERSPSEASREDRAVRRRLRGGHPKVRVALVAGLSVIVLITVGFVVMAQLTHAAEPEPVERLAADPAVRTSWSYGDVVMTPTGDSDGTGLVFFAGAKVDPLAFADKLSGLVEAGSTVVIVRPMLNFAILEWRPLSDFTARAPEVTEWFVGGHSLGGVKACQYAGDDAVSGLVLVGSYCAGDIGDLGKPVLSISASNDGLSTPAKIDASRADLPTDTEFVVIEGANHAQFGDYGTQPGDGDSTVSDDAVRDELTAALGPFIQKQRN